MLNCYFKQNTYLLLLLQFLILMFIITLHLVIRYGRAIITLCTIIKENYFIRKKKVREPSTLTISAITSHNKMLNKISRHVRAIRLKHKYRIFFLLFKQYVLEIEDKFTFYQLLLLISYITRKE